MQMLYIEWIPPSAMTVLAHHIHSHKHTLVWSRKDGAVVTLSTHTHTHTPQRERERERERGGVAKR